MEEKLGSGAHQQDVPRGGATGEAAAAGPPCVLLGRGVKELLPGHTEPFPHEPNPQLPAAPRPSTTTRVRGECVCAHTMGGGGARLFNNVAFHGCASTADGFLQTVQSAISDFNVSILRLMKTVYTQRRT